MKGFLFGAFDVRTSKLRLAETIGKKPSKRPPPRKATQRSGLFPGSPVDFTRLKDKTYALISLTKKMATLEATLEASRVDFAYKCKNLRTIKLPKN